MTATVLCGQRPSLCTRSQRQDNEQASSNAKMPWYTVNVPDKTEHDIVTAAFARVAAPSSGMLFHWAQARDIDWAGVLAGKCAASSCPIFNGEMANIYNLALPCDA
jgi:hypothetical protein